MANTCFFEFKFKGNEEGIKKIVDLFEETNKYNVIPQIGRVESASYYKDGDITYVCGGCAWSVSYAIFKDFKGSVLETLIKEYALEAEAFGDEPMECFFEHFRWENGERVEEKYLDYSSGSRPEETWAIDNKLREV